MSPADAWRALVCVAMAHVVLTIVMVHAERELKRQPPGDRSLSLMLLYLLVVPMRWMLVGAGAVCAALALAPDLT